LKENSDEFRDRYRWRAGIEATMSRFKYQMGMAQLRIRGMVRVRYTARLRALGLNIHRVTAWRKAVAVNWAGYEAQHAFEMGHNYSRNNADAAISKHSCFPDRIPSTNSPARSYQ
jgi:hypothetical protein